MELLAPQLARDHEPCCFENAQVFHHAEPRHAFHFGVEFALRLAPEIKQVIQ